MIVKTSLDTVCSNFGTILATIYKLRSQLGLKNTIWVLKSLNRPVRQSKVLFANNIQIKRDNLGGNRVKTHKNPLEKLVKSFSIHSPTHRLSFSLFDWCLIIITLSVNIFLLVAYCLCYGIVQGCTYFSSECNIVADTVQHGCGQLISYSVH